MKNISTAGIDLAKTVFQIHGVDEQNNIVLQKKVSRSKLMEVIANLPKCLIGFDDSSFANAISSRKPNRAWHFWQMPVR